MFGFIRSCRLFPAIVLFYASLVSSQQTVLRTPSESPLSIAPGLQGNAGALRKSNGSISQIGLTLNQSGAYEDIDISTKMGEWSLGFKTAENSDIGFLGLSHASLLFPNLSFGGSLKYVWSDDFDFWIGDLGVLWTPGRMLSAGYYTKGLWQTETRHHKQQTAAVGFRPLFFSQNWLQKIMLEYQLAVPGVKLSDWEHLEHGVGLYIQPLPWTQISARYNFEDESVGLGISIQSSPHGLLGWNLSLPDKGDAVHEAVIRINKHIAPRFMSLPAQMAVFNLNVSIVEGEVEYQWLSRSQVMGQHNLLRALDNISRLKGIQFVMVKTGRTKCSWAIAADIREKLLQLNNKGIRTIAYMESVDLINYYIASGCERIAAHPACYFDVRGFSSEVLFYKGFMDKIGLSTQFVRHGKYKSYPEVFTRDSMSAEWKENLTQLLQGFWSHYLDAVAEARGISRDSMGPLFERNDISMRGAQKAGLLDTILQEDQLKEYMGFPKARPYPAMGKEMLEADWHIGPEIALIRIEGGIMQGNSNPGGLFSISNSGSQTLVRYLRKARLEHKVKAVVLRINSPGGSAIASDMIYRELELMKKAEKPIIVSMGSACASGGYYVACGADAIVTRENTVTGSIGIFGGKVILKGLYDHLGISTETVKTSKFADASSMGRPWAEEEIGAVQTYIDSFYNRFVTIVAVNRNLSADSADFLAQGKVFTGLQAVQNGLADTLGGLETAIALAKQKAGIPRNIRCNIVEYKKAPSLWDQPLARLTQSPADQLLQALKQLKNRLADTKIWALSPEAMALME